MSGKLFKITHIISFVTLYLSLCNILSAQWLETTIQVDNQPCALVWNSTNNKIYCANYGSNNLSIIDGEENLVIATVSLGYYPVALVWNSINNKIYCAVYGSSRNDKVIIIDGETDTIITIVPVGYGPNTLIWNATNNKVYCANQGGQYDPDSTITIIDGAADSVITTVQVGISPCALVWNLTNNKVYSANNNSNSVTIIDGEVNSVITTIPAGYNPIALAWNSTNNKVYCANAGGYPREVTVIDGLGDSVIKRVNLDYTGPLFSLAWNSVNNKVYCANFGGVTIIDGETDSVIASILISSGFRILNWNPINNKLYCANSDSATVTIIDGQTDSVLVTIAVGNSPDAFAWNSFQNRTYIANRWSSSISVIRDEIPGIEENTTLSVDRFTLEIFPNPAKLYFTIRFSQTADRKEIKIFDVSGKLIKEIATPTAHNEGEIAVSLKGMNPGIYFLRLGKETKKFLVVE